MKGGICIQFGKFGISDPVLSVASNHSAVALRSGKKWGCFFLSKSESETSLIEQKRQGLLELKYTIRD